MKTSRLKLKNRTKKNLKINENENKTFQNLRHSKNSSDGKFTVIQAHLKK